MSNILIFILLLVLFYFVFSYQENFGGVTDDCNNRLLNLDGRSVNDTDKNYKFVSDDCKMIGKNPLTLQTKVMGTNGMQTIQSISCIDNLYNRLGNINGRCVNKTDTNYKYISDDCKMIGKEPTLCDPQQKYKTLPTGQTVPNGIEYKGTQCLNKQV